MPDADVVVVGARCAGSPLAAMLAARGLCVVVVDRARLPSDIASTHVVQPRGARVLDRLGVLDDLLAATPPLAAFTLVNDDVRIDTAIPTDLGPTLCVRRVTLDVALADAASRAGAEVRTGVTVHGVRTRQGRVVGVDTDAGPITADLVVGADGRKSVIARSVGAVEYATLPAGRMPIWGYFEGVRDPESRLRLARLGELAFLSCPCDGGLYLAGVAPAMAHRDAVLAAREHTFTSGIAQWPELADLLAGARRVGPLRTVPDWYGYHRQPTGPGWLLTGDAGHFKDPTPAQGIADALCHAERLAEMIANTSGSERDDALAGWWRERDQDGMEMYWFAADLGAPGAATPLVTNVLRDIGASAEATTTFLRVLDRQMRPAQLFTMRRLARAAVRTAVQRPREIPALVREVGRTIWQEVGRARVTTATRRRTRRHSGRRARTRAAPVPSCSSCS